MVASTRTSAVAEAWRRWWRVEAHGSLIGDCLVSWHVALIPSILLLLVAHALFEQAGVDVQAHQKPPEDLAPRSVWMTVLVAPVVETVLLGAFLRLLQFATRRPQWLAVTSALAWGGAHAWFYPFWFFGTVWSFYVFSRGWLAWRPVSYKHAFGAAALPHALVNSSALLMQFFARS
jgi:hypothetical protein